MRGTPVRPAGRVPPAARRRSRCARRSVGHRQVAADEAARARSVTISMVTGESVTFATVANNTLRAPPACSSSTCAVSSTSMSTRVQRRTGRCARATCDDVAEQPLQQVKRVDRLVDQDAAAAVARPPAPWPGFGSTRGRGATARWPSAPQHRAELAGAEQRPAARTVGVVPVLQAHPDLDVRCCAAAFAISRSASATVCATGFSTSTWRPRPGSRAPPATCWSCGVHTCTTSGRTTSSITRWSSNAGAPYACPALSAVLRFVSQTPTSRAFPPAASASTASSGPRRRHHSRPRPPSRGPLLWTGLLRRSSDLRVAPQPEWHGCAAGADVARRHGWSPSVPTYSARLPGGDAATFGTAVDGSRR